jgi:hypothetical protein
MKKTTELSGKNKKQFVEGVEILVGYIFDKIAGEKTLMTRKDCQYLLTCLQYGTIGRTYNNIPTGTYLRMLMRNAPALAQKNVKKTSSAVKELMRRGYVQE